MTGISVCFTDESCRTDLRRASTSRRTLLYRKGWVGFRRVSANLLTGDYREENERDERELVEHD